MDVVIFALFYFVLPIAIIGYVCESLHTLRKGHAEVVQQLALLHRELRTVTARLPERR